MQGPIISLFPIYQANLLEECYNRKDLGFFQGIKIKVQNFFRSPWNHFINLKLLCEWSKILHLDPPDQPRFAILRPNLSPELIGYLKY